MKIGVKTYDDRFFLHHFKGKVDFFEVMAIEDTDYSYLKEFSMPIVIHVEHRTFGVNFADKTKEKQNISAINFARKIAEMIKAEKIIIHPGHLENSNCSEKNALNSLKKMNDERILTENMPRYFNNSISLCHTPEEMKKILKKAKCKFCLDINHAVVSAIELKKDYIKFLKEFIKLKPSHYHLGGQKLSGKKESHIALEESEMDLKEILKLLPKNAYITLETEPDIEKTEQDIKIIRAIIKQI